MFTLFSKLPTEVRLQIWREAAISDTRVPRNAVVTFDCRWDWPESDIICQQPSGKDPFIKVQCPSPWAIRLASYEAQAVTDEVVAEMGLVWETVQPYKHAILTRDFIPEEDFIYLPRKAPARAALSKAIAASFLYDETHWVNRRLSRIHHLVLPAFTAYYSMDSIVQAMDRMPNLQRVYVAWGSVPQVIWQESEHVPDDLQDDEYEGVVGIDVQPLWTVEYLPPVPEDYIIPDEEDDDGEADVTRSDRDVEVEMIVDDEESDTRWVETGSLWEWMSEIRDAISTFELGDSFTNLFTDPAEGTVTLEIVPVKVVVDGDTIPELTEAESGRYWS